MPYLPKRKKKPEQIEEEEEVEEFTGEEDKEEEVEEKENTIEISNTKDKDTDDNSKEKHTIVVVKELPVKVVRVAKADDGTIIHYITIEEALTKRMNA